MTNITRVEDYERDIFGFIGYNEADDQIVVAFRGTNGIDLRNWLTNFEQDHVPYKDVFNARVHKGWFSAYLAIEEKVFTTVQAQVLLHPSASILITGHSLGGVLGTLAAVDINRFVTPKARVQLYTYGQPRVGNSEFADYVMGLLPDGEYQRVTHFNDMVVRNPLEVMGYKHAGDEVFYYSPAFGDLDYHVCINEAGKPENRDCAESQWIAAGVEEHLYYLGVRVGMMCSVYEDPYLAALK